MKNRDRQIAVKMNDEQYKQLMVDVDKFCKDKKISFSWNTYIRHKLFKEDRDHKE